MVGCCCCRPYTRWPQSFLKGAQMPRCSHSHSPQAAVPWWVLRLVSERKKLAEQPSFLKAALQAGSQAQRLTGYRLQVNKLQATGPSVASPQQSTGHWSLVVWACCRRTAPTGKPPPTLKKLNRLARVCSQVQRPSIWFDATAGRKVW